MATAKKRKTTTTKRKTTAVKRKATTGTKRKTTTSTKSKTTATKSKTTAYKAKPKAPSSVRKAWTRTQQITYISEQTGLTKKEITAVIDCFEPMIKAHLNGPAKQIALGGLMKVVAVRKPATKARKGVNPFTGEPTVFKAKPARNVVKVRPLKKVKELVA